MQNRIISMYLHVFIIFNLCSKIHKTQTQHEMYKVHVTKSCNLINEKNLFNATLPPAQYACIHPNRKNNTFFHQKIKFWSSSCCTFSCQLCFFYTSGFIYSSEQVWRTWQNFLKCDHVTNFFRKFVWYVLKVKGWVNL